MCALCFGSGASNPVSAVADPALAISAAGDLVSHPALAIYIHVPKTGGTSIQNLLACARKATDHTDKVTRERVAGSRNENDGVWVKNPVLGLSRPHPHAGCCRRGVFVDRNVNVCADVTIVVGQKRVGGLRACCDGPRLETHVANI